MSTFDNVQSQQLFRELLGQLRRAPNLASRLADVAQNHGRDSRKMAGVLMQVVDSLQDRIDLANQLIYLLDEDGDDQK